LGIARTGDCEDLLLSYGPWLSLYAILFPIRWEERWRRGFFYVNPAPRQGKWPRKVILLSLALSVDVYVENGWFEVVYIVL